MGLGSAYSDGAFIIFYHTAPGKALAGYSPYANENVDRYMDEAMSCSDLEESYELWKKAQWDGRTGIYPGWRYPLDLAG